MGVVIYYFMKMFSKIEFTLNHADWLNAVMENNVEAVRLQIEQSSEETKHLLMEGRICDDNFWPCRPREEAESQKIMTVHRPLSLAAVCGSCDVIQEFAYLRYRYVPSRHTGE